MCVVCYYRDRWRSSVARARPGRGRRARGRPGPGRRARGRRPVGGRRRAGAGTGAARGTRGSSPRRCPPYTSSHSTMLSISTLRSTGNTYKIIPICINVSHSMNYSNWTQTSVLHLNSMGIESASHFANIRLTNKFLLCVPTALIWTYTVSKSDAIRIQHYNLSFMLPVM